MAGVIVVYPDTLPHPEVGQFTPRERRAINREFMRPISRDRSGVRSVAFTYTPAQAREFREWYREWTTMGGGMFAAPWPMPWGRGPHVFRFVEPPTWQLIGGGVDGQGYWRVTANVELRGRGETPELEVFIVTSKPYPTEVEDSLSGQLSRFYDVPHPFWDDGMEAPPPTYSGGSLREPLVAYDDWEPENITADAPTYLNGQLRTPLVVYDKWPVEELTSPLPVYVDGTLEQVLIQYTNWILLVDDDESITATPPTYIDGTLT